MYNGKELNGDFGLNWSDYGARWYDASIGRWNAVDPLAETTPSWNAYNYVQNTPINAIDPNGLSCEGCKWNTDYATHPREKERFNPLIYDWEDFTHPREEERFKPWIIASGNSTQGPDDWIKVNGKYKWDNEISNQEEATKKYGKDAEYVGLTHTYTAWNGKEVSLFHNGKWDWTTIEAGRVGSISTLGSSGYSLLSEEIMLDIAKGASHTTALRASKILGNTFSVVSYFSSTISYRYDWKEAGGKYPGHYSTVKFGADVGVNTWGLYNIQGAAFNVGWAGGSLITRTNAYQNIKHNYILKTTGGRDGLISTDY